MDFFWCIDCCLVSPKHDTRIKESTLNMYCFNKNPGRFLYIFYWEEASDYKKGRGGMKELDNTVPTKLSCIPALQQLFE